MKTIGYQKSCQWQVIFRFKHKTFEKFNFLVSLTNYEAKYKIFFEDINNFAIAW
jgi:hypothetical protein